MKINELLDEYNNIETVDFEEPVDPFKAVTDALIALGVEEPVIGQVNPGEDVYEITYKHHGKIFDDTVIRGIVSTLEDELNALF